MRKSIAVIFLIILLTACGPTAEEQAAQTSVAATTTASLWTLTPSLTVTPEPSATPTPTDAPSKTPTPSITPTPTITLTPTFSFPAAVVNQQAHCRYGPSKAYLHAADLYPGDAGTVRGRFAYSKWLYVKFDKLAYFCWVAPSVVDVTGDISTIELTKPSLPGPSVLYPPVSGVIATRSGDEVTITWDVLNMTEDDDRGYFIEAWVCQDGSYLWWTVSFPDENSTSYIVKDQSGCPAQSKGKLYGVEKHGYTEPVEIPWPAP